MEEIGVFWKFKLKWMCKTPDRSADQADDRQLFAGPQPVWDLVNTIILSGSSWLIEPCLLREVDDQSAVADSVDVWRVDGCLMLFPNFRQNSHILPPINPSINQRPNCNAVLCYATTLWLYRSNGRKSGSNRFELNELSSSKRPAHHVAPASTSYREVWERNMGKK